MTIDSIWMRAIRSHFPFLLPQSEGEKLCYLDNAATTHKPNAVIDAISQFYRTSNANIYRGAYALGEQATEQFEGARSRVAQFIGASSSAEIVFTSGATDGINMVVGSWAQQHVKAGDEVLVTELEHHANFVPWQRLCLQVGAQLRVVPVLPDGQLDYERFEQLLSPKTKLVAVTAISNAIGTVVDLPRIILAARAVGAKVLVDAAQLVPHSGCDVGKLDPDFIVFSGHKMLGPTGVGVLYVKQELHDQLVPYRCGGGMVREVSLERSTYLGMPHLLEAGTPPIAQAVGLGVAIDYLQQQVPFAQLREHEAALCAFVIERLCMIPKIRLLGPLDQLARQGHMVSFVVDGIHAHDVAAYLDRDNIAVRAGNHCAQPLANRLGYDASVRASFYCYTTVQDVECLCDAVERLCSSP